MLCTYARKSHVSEFVEVGYLLNSERISRKVDLKTLILDVLYKSDIMIT